MPRCSRPRNSTRASALINSLGGGSVPRLSCKRPRAGDELQMLVVAVRATGTNWMPTFLQKLLVPHRRLTTLLPSSSTR
jgi:hypothetical protein